MNKYSKLVFGIIFLFFLSLFFSSNITSAVSRNITRYTQGATITEKYFIYTTCNNSGYCSPFRITRCNRPKGDKCVSLPKNTSKAYNGKPVSMYYKWGSKYAQVVTKENGSMYCFQLDPFKKVSDKKCGSMMESDGLSAKKDIKSKRQGWAKYGKCYIRGYGDNSGMTNYIWLFKSRNHKIAEWKVPHSGGEIEDVMSDGSGQIWYTYALNGNKVTYYKMKKSVSQKWNKKCKASSSSSSGSESSGDEYTGPTTIPGTYGTGMQDAPAIEFNKNDGIVETAFFGTIQEDGEGCGVYTVMSLVITIMSIGIGITAIIGISIAGIIYLTSGSNVARATLAKRRLYEIIIGLIAYVALVAILTFLLPEFNPELRECQQTTAEATTEQEDQQ